MRRSEVVALKATRKPISQRRFLFQDDKTGSSLCELESGLLYPTEIDIDMYMYKKYTNVRATEWA